MFVPALINNADQAGVESLFQSVESQTRDELHHSDGWFADYKRLSPNPPKEGVGLAS